MVGEMIAGFVFLGMIGLMILSLATQKNDSRRVTPYSG